MRWNLTWSLKSPDSQSKPRQSGRLGSHRPQLTERASQTTLFQQSALSALYRQWQTWNSLKTVICVRAKSSYNSIGQIRGLERIFLLVQDPPKVGGLSGRLGIYFPFWLTAVQLTDNNLEAQIWRMIRVLVGTILVQDGGNSTSMPIPQHPWIMARVKIRIL